jgi:hypothetical protein
MYPSSHTGTIRIFSTQPTKFHFSLLLLSGSKPEVRLMQANSMALWRDNLGRAHVMEGRNSGAMHGLLRLLSIIACCLECAQIVTPGILRRELTEKMSLTMTSGGRVRVASDGEHLLAQSNDTDGTNTTLQDLVNANVSANVSANGTECVNGTHPDGTVCNGTHTLINGTWHLTPEAPLPSNELNTTENSVPTPPPPTPIPAGVCPKGWICNTWVTGKWDCCKPTCAWNGKGNVTSPVLACNAVGFKITDNLQTSMCDGGSDYQTSDIRLAGACPSWMPWQVNAGLSYGVASIKAGGVEGLMGDVNCGQCYELVFTGQASVWDETTGTMTGGAHPDLVHKRMVVQVIDVGTDVTGAHSFEIYMPGGGQGATTNGCARQYNDPNIDNFDCGQRYGGCNAKVGCGNIPTALKSGCEWRFDWLRWMENGAQTNNPFVKFRRVKCPAEITAKTRSTAMDDDNPNLPSA